MLLKKTILYIITSVDEEGVGIVGVKVVAAAREQTPLIEHLLVYLLMQLGIMAGSFMESFRRKDGVDF